MSSSVMQDLVTDLRAWMTSFIKDCFAEVNLAASYHILMVPCIGGIIDRGPQRPILPRNTIRYAWFSSAPLLQHVSDECRCNGGCTGCLGRCSSHHCTSYLFNWVTDAIHGVGYRLKRIAAVCWQSRLPNFDCIRLTQAWVSRDLMRFEWLELTAFELVLLYKLL